MNNNNYKNAGQLFLCFTLFFAIGVDAATLDYTADISSVYSDNINRQPDDGLDELIVSPGFGFDVASEGGKLEGEARGDIRYLDYTKNTFNNETLGAFGGSAVWTLIPQALTWSIEDNFGQTVTNPFQAITPGNREDINYFSTGPNITARLWGPNSLLIGGRYANESYETTPSDNEQYSGYVAFSHALSSGRTLSFYVRTARIEFDNMMLNSNYDVQSAYIELESETSRSSFLFNIGTTELHDGGMKTSDLLFDLNMTRTLSGASSITFSATQRFDETGQSFSASQNGASAVQGTQDTIAGGDPFLHQGASLDYQMLNDRVNFGLGATWADDDYETADQFDRESTGARLTLGYGLTPRADLLFTGTYTHSDYSTVNQKDDDVGATLEFSQQMGRNISLVLAYSYFSRDSNMAILNYDENRGTVRIEYTR